MAMGLIIGVIGDNKSKDHPSKDSGLGLLA